MTESSGEKGDPATFFDEDGVQTARTLLCPVQQLPKSHNGLILEGGISSNPLNHLPCKTDAAHYVPEAKGQKVVHEEVQRKVFDSTPQHPSSVLDLAQHVESPRKKQRVAQGGDFEQCARLHDCDANQCTEHAAETACEEDDAASPVRRKRRKKQYKKPKDMPRRPLSAYNIFFREERSKILPELKARSDKGRSTSKEPGLFSTMGRTIAARWNNLDSRDRQKYEAYAQVEMRRYQLEMMEYRARLVVPSETGANDEAYPSASSQSLHDDKLKGDKFASCPTVLKHDGHHALATSSAVTVDDSKLSTILHDGRTPKIDEEETQCTSNRIFSTPDFALSGSVNPFNRSSKQDHSSMKQLGFTDRNERTTPAAGTIQTAVFQSTPLALNTNLFIRQLDHLLLPSTFSSTHNAVHNTIVDRTAVEEILTRLIAKEQHDRALRETIVQRSQIQQRLGTVVMDGLDVPLATTVSVNTNVAVAASHLLNTATRIADERRLLDQLFSERTSLDTKLAILRIINASSQSVTGGALEEVRHLVQGVGPRIDKTLQRSSAINPIGCEHTPPAITSNEHVLHALLRLDRGSMNQPLAQLRRVQSRQDRNETTEPTSLLRTLLLANKPPETRKHHSEESDLEK